MTPLDKKLERFPPLVCRLLARAGPKNSQRPLTDAEISAVSGIPLAKVISMSWLTSWDDVTCKDMLDFSKGCGVDFSDAKIMRKHLKYLELASRFVYLRRNVGWHSRWCPMLDIYRDVLRNKYKKG